MKNLIAGILLVSSFSVMADCSDRATAKAACRNLVKVDDVEYDDLKIVFHLETLEVAISMARQDVVDCVYTIENTSTFLGTTQRGINDGYATLDVKTCALVDGVYRSGRNLVD